MKAEDKGNLLYFAAHTHAHTTEIVAMGPIKTGFSCILTHLLCLFNSSLQAWEPWQTERTVGPGWDKDSLLSVKAVLPPPLPPPFPSPPSFYSSSFFLLSLLPTSLHTCDMWYVETRGDHRVSSSIPFHLVQLRQGISWNLGLGWWPENSNDPSFLLPLAPMMLGLKTCTHAQLFIWVWEIGTHVPMLEQWTLLL